ncbi:redox-regulated ATPase YchF [Haloferax volcanii]|uniref:Translation-associated GTPase n=2 Tax=Haloferax volcanii TaxID=2246 RepID=M0GSI9_HALL2|nr:MULTISPECIES: redox-regulated ATPase YchF [Haloferax]ELK53323.1 translation-associated GTPase [Haloferax sp. BAB-2207]ELZ74487.1 translation-associated GTPase [Haloferax lucentense DSM 14919]QIB78667.1 redox-regulated ATPase YchF [Haloferax alexandrinus]
MLSLALAGKPNAGKSTFYTASTLAEVDVANYPFTTIDANRGVTHARTRCPCLDRDERCGNCEDGIRYVAVELVDVAGLVPGAHEGRGLGNQFLDELTNADAIVNVVDASGGTNAEGEPVEVGSFDPVEEVDFIEEELEQWLAGIVHKNWESVVRKSRSPDFDMDDALSDLLTGVGASEYDIAAVLRQLDYSPNPRDWDDADRVELARAIRQRTKPIVLVANKVDIAPPENLERLAETGKPVIAATADGELALRRAREAGIIDYHPGDDDFELVGDVSGAQEQGLERIRDLMGDHGGTGTQEAIDTAVYDVLDRITVYPVQNESKWTDGTGNVLPDAFLLPRGSTPRDLAYAVHSDIGDGYLHAVDARAKRRIAEDHELEEGDVIKIVSTAK